MTYNDLFGAANSIWARFTASQQLHAHTRLSTVAGKSKTPEALAYQPLLLGIDGPSGAGKTILAEQLAALISQELLVSANKLSPQADKRPVLSIALEDYYPGWDGLAAGVNVVSAAVHSVLVAKQPAHLIKWDWQSAQPGAEVVWRPCQWFQPGTVVIIEGCGALSAQIAPFLNWRVWIQAPEPERRARVWHRDQTWDYPWQAWADQERQLYANLGYPPPAEMVVDTSGFATVQS